MWSEYEHQTQSPDASLSAACAFGPRRTGRRRSAMILRAYSKAYGVAAVVVRRGATVRQHENVTRPAAQPPVCATFLYNTSYSLACTHSSVQYMAVWVRCPPHTRDTSQYSVATYTVVGPKPGKHNMALASTLHGSWNRFQLASNTHPLSVIGRVVVPYARIHPPRERHT